MRYIDADKVMEEINQIGGHNLCEWETIGVKALIDRQPTADVVPKSEVEKLTVELDAMRGAANSYKIHYDSIAREIFEEIEKLHLHITNEFDVRRYTELKKKYTEE